MGDTLTEETFDAVVAQDGLPYLVDFWAPWCGRCRLLAPAIDRLEQEYAGRLRVGKLDVDTQPGIARRFGVQSLPTVLLIEHGEPVARLDGVITPARLREAVGAHLEPAAGS